MTLRQVFQTGSKSPHWDGTRVVHGGNLRDDTLSVGFFLFLALLLHSSVCPGATSHRNVHSNPFSVFASGKAEGKAKSQTFCSFIQCVLRDSGFVESLLNMEPSHSVHVQTGG